MMINKYNRVFFAQRQDDQVAADIDNNQYATAEPISASSNFTKKKRNLVALSTPLIVKLTPYEKEVTTTDVATGEQATEIITYHKTNKSFNQILDAYLMDRTIKIYDEKKLKSLNDNVSDIRIAAALPNSVEIYKRIINNKTFYKIFLDELYFSTSPDTYMTTEDLTAAELITSNVEAGTTIDPDDPSSQEEA